MNRSKKKARYIAKAVGKELPVQVRRTIHFAKLRAPLNRIPLYMSLIGRRGAVKTNSSKLRLAA